MRVHLCIASCTICVFGAPQVAGATVASSRAQSLIRRKLQARPFWRAASCRRDCRARARGTTGARSQVRRNCASDCATQCASEVQRMTVASVLVRTRARQSLQLCGAVAAATRAPARARRRRCTRAAPARGRDAADARHANCADSGHGNGHRNAFQFFGTPCDA